MEERREKVKGKTGKDHARLQVWQCLKPTAP